MNRCIWAGTDPQMVAYHDTEWGVPVYEDNKLFEFLCLEGAQAGLSWSTVLKKRERYREIFNRFNVATIAKYTKQQVDIFVQDPGIIRNRAKIESCINNAKLVSKIADEFGSFSNYIWKFVDAPITNTFESTKDIPSYTELSKQISKDMKKRGFKFIGPTIIYAFMQAIGVVNDHEISCFRYSEISDMYDKCD